jgi:hypothetical protein
MQIPAEVAERMLTDLRASPLFALQTSVTNRPYPPLWSAMNGCLLDLRLPLYHKRLQKKPPKPAATNLAVQRSLTMLAAFAAACHMGQGYQAVVSSENGWVTSISFQPRPYGMNWTAKHAIDPPEAVLRAGPRSDLEVSIEDVLHLAAKVVHAVAGYQAGALPDLTATYRFGRMRLMSLDEVPSVNLIVREHEPSVMVYHANLNHELT